MTYRDKQLTADDLRNLRALRALLMEAYGTIEDLSRLEFTLGTEDVDTLAAFGLGDSAWAHERLAQLRSALGAPLAGETNKGRAQVDVSCEEAA